MSFDDIPTMKELNTRYRRLALLKHPDKNGGSDKSKEEYQQLQNHYKVLGNFIVETDVDRDEEERDHVTTFKNFNFDKRNSKSHTILLENKLTKAWKEVLIRKYNEPENKGTNGLIFKLENFSVNEEIFIVTITLYEDPNDKQPKLHIQGPSQFVNDEFTLTELPSLYAEVRKSSPPETIVNGTSVDETESNENNAKIGIGARIARHSRGRVTKQSAKTITKNIVKYCKVQACEFTSKVTKDMNLHQKTHQRKESFDQQRDLGEGNLAMDTESEESVEKVTESPSPVVPPVPPFNFQNFQADYENCHDEKIKLEKLVLELKEKVTELEKDVEKMRKKSEKDEKDWEKDLAEAKKNLIDLWRKPPPSARRTLC